ncbi:MAG: DUF4192 domain-containing protein [Aeromicrobium sp.]
MTESRTAFTAHNVPDLLDLLPALFGFSPEQSFIAIATYGARRRFGFRLRMDMPPLDQVVAAAAQIANYLRLQDADGVILVAVTDHETVADTLMEAVRDELRGLPVHDAVRTDGATYWVYGPDGPGEGRAYVGRCSPAVVGAIVNGMQILPNRQALVDRFAPVVGIRKVQMEIATEKALDRALMELPKDSDTNLAEVGLATVDPILRRQAGGATLSDDDRASLAIWVSSIGVRDELWSRMTRANANDMLELWIDISRSVVDPFEAPVLCLAAFAAWLGGDGAQALIAAERALEFEPGYSMALLILRILDGGLSPQHWDGFDAGWPMTS